MPQLISMTSHLRRTWPRKKLCERNCPETKSGFHKLGERNLLIIPTVHSYSRNFRHRGKGGSHPRGWLYLILGALWWVANVFFQIRSRKLSTVSSRIKMTQVNSDSGKRMTQAKTDSGKKCPEEMPGGNAPRKCLEKK